MTGLIIFVIITTICVLYCIIATIVCITEHLSQQRKSKEEIEHLHEEVRACRKLLRRKENKGNA